MPWIDVCREEELQAGQRRIVATLDGPVLVVRLDDGSIVAVEDRCSHDGGELGSGTIEGDQIICPRHGARFCLRNGRVLSPPAYEDIESYPVRVQDGVIQVEVG